MITKKLAIKAPIGGRERDLRRHWVKDHIADMFPDEVIEMTHV